MNLILGDGLLGTPVIGSSGWAYVSRKEGGFDINKKATWKNNIPKSTTTIINLIANTDTYSSDAFGMFNAKQNGIFINYIIFDENENMQMCICC